MNPVATSDAAFRGGACPTPEYTIAYTGNYTTSADANGGLAGLAAVWPTIGMSFEAEAKGKITFVIIMALSFLAAKNIKKSINK